MLHAEAGEITRLLHAFNDGDRDAAERLMTIIYDELRRIAGYYMRQECPDHTLQPTALVNEVYIRLFGDNPIEYQNHGHFFAVAAQQMRRILVDHARHHQADRRGGQRTKISLDEIFEAVLELPQQNDADLVALDDALSDLDKFEPRMRQVVELRFFGGLTIIETAKVLGISKNTVTRDWDYAKVWLYKQLSPKQSSIVPGQ